MMNSLFVSYEEPSPNSVLLISRSVTEPSMYVGPYVQISKQNCVSIRHRWSTVDVIFVAN